jgi:hypothetical protein
MLQSTRFNVCLIGQLRLALMALFMSIIAVPLTANADSIGGRHVTDIGCEGPNCYVTFDGAPAAGLAGTTCAASANEFRWDGTTPAGKLIYASMLSASATGKAVSVYYNSCYSGYNGTYLTIQYFHISG